MRKKLIIALIAVLVLAALGTGYMLLKKESASDKSKPVNTVDYGPQTEQEKRETEAFKKAQQENNKPKPLPEASDGRSKVSPVIAYTSYADGIAEVSAFIPGIIEDGGTCTLKLANSSKTITRTTTGVGDATTTRCPIFSILGQDINPKGDWTATVSYSSDKATGTSESAILEVK